MKKIILTLLLTAISISIISRLPQNTSLAVQDLDIEQNITESEVVDKLAELKKPTYNIVIVEKEAKALAQMAWGEARGCGDMGMAATMWVVLNRADAWNKSVFEVVSAPGQFHGYLPYFPVEDHIYDIAVDVLTRWQMEKQGASAEEVGRVLPKDYLYFNGDGQVNWFRISYEHTGDYWDWSLPNPYETEEN